MSFAMQHRKCLELSDAFSQQYGKRTLVYYKCVYIICIHTYMRLIIIIILHDDIWAFPFSTLVFSSCFLWETGTIE